MIRTYGRLELRADGDRSFWDLFVEPQIAMRAKRIFPRVVQTRAGALSVAHTPDVARDLEWLLERWPLAADATAMTVLHGSAEAHREMERKVTRVLAPAAPRLDLPREPAKEPRDYQRAAVELLRVRKSLLLTDELGLGKTFTALLSLVHEDALPAVVVPPTHLPRRWMQEMTDAFPWLQFEVAPKMYPPAGWGDQMVLPDVLIVPYSKLAGWSSTIAGWARTVIFDEVQELRRGERTQRGAGAGEVADAADYVLGLTATPVYNYGGEIWSIMDILARGSLGFAHEFTTEWGSSYGGKVVVREPAALGSYLREQGLMLGRTRKDVGRELPKTIKVEHPIDSDPEALQAVAGDTRRMAELILSSTSTRQERWTAAGEIEWQMRQATGIGKAPYVAEFCRMLLEAEKKIVLFGWHRAVYDIWLNQLEEFRPVMYTGSESPKQKAEAEKAFIDGDARVLIMSLRSGAGVDGLQKASNVAVFGELDWSPQVHEQAIGRLRRDGMGDAPPVAYFLTSGEGSDPVILETLQVKRNQAEPLISRDGRLLANSTPDRNRGRSLATHILSTTKEHR